MSLRCFVAMAFDRSDTDKVYDRLIRPTLKAIGIRTVRIDREPHNDDIDDRIIFELQRCDLALADLTFARPSVYFEAGYAQREVPVVYTCRRDHFSRKADDEFGNLRVHFDLQMKNIIPWTDSADPDFARLLRARIVRVIAPVLRDQRAQETKRQEREQFSALPQAEQVDRILRICVLALRHRGYKGPQVSFDALERWHGTNFRSAALSLIDTPLWRHSTLGPGWVGTKTVGNAIHAAIVHVSPNLTKGRLLDLRGIAIDHPVYDMAVARANTTLPAELLVESVFAVSLDKVRLNSVKQVLPRFSAHASNRPVMSLQYETSDSVPTATFRSGLRMYRLRKHWKLGGDELLVVQDPKRKLDPDCASFKLKDGVFNVPQRNQVFFDDGLIPGKHNDYTVKTKDIPRHVQVHLVDGIKSEATFRMTFLALLKTLERRA